MPSGSNRISLRSKILAAIIGIVGLVLPAQFWYSVWFGRELTNQEIGEYLQTQDHARKIQHALSQIEERIRKGDPEVSKWYPRVAALADNSNWMIRNEVAWVMGQDPSSEAFHQALLKLIDDPDLAVRRNAALSLVRHGDSQALPEVRGMLQPVEIVSPAAGKTDFKVKVGQWVSPGDELVQVAGAIVRAKLSGRVLELPRPSEAVAPGDALMEISPDPQSVWEGLRALFLLGEREDIPLVKSIAADPTFDERVRRQAELAEQAIASR